MLMFKAIKITNQKPELELLENLLADGYRIGQSIALDAFGIIILVKDVVEPEVLETVELPGTPPDLGVFTQETVNTQDHFGGK